MGKPGTSHVVSPAPEYIGCVGGTWGSETSQYPQEEKTICDSVSSGERKRMRLNRACVIPVRGCVCGVVGWSLVENCTVDASILFFVFKLSRANGGCLGTRSR